MFDASTGLINPPEPEPPEPAELECPSPTKSADANTTPPDAQPCTIPPGRKYITGLEAIHAELPILKPLIDPWLAPGELVVIYGRDTRARTLFAMTAAYAAAFGGYVAGFRWSVREPVRVLHVAAASGRQAIQANARAVIGSIHPYPGQLDLRSGLSALSDQALQDRLQFPTPALGYRLDLAKQREPARYRDEEPIKSGLGRFASSFKGRGLIILDPFYACAAFRDLNSPAEVGRVMSGLASLAREHGCAVLLLLPEREKFRKGDDPAPLGTSRITMDADTVIRIVNLLAEPVILDGRPYWDVQLQVTYEKLLNATPDAWCPENEAGYILSLPRSSDHGGWQVSEPNVRGGYSGPNRKATPVQFQDAYLNPRFATYEQIGAAIGLNKGSVSRRARELSLPDRGDLLSGKARWPMFRTASALASMVASLADGDEGADF